LSLLDGYDKRGVNPLGSTEKPLRAAAAQPDLISAIGFKKKFENFGKAMPDWIVSMKTFLVSFLILRVS